MTEPTQQAARQRDGTARRPVTRRSSFSLIELLTVVAIIMVLIGIALKVTSYVQRKTGGARTLWVLEQVKNALGSYYTVYGSYPPVTAVKFTYEGGSVAGLPATPDGGYQWKTGLVYYLWNGDKHNPDPEVDRWQNFLTGLKSGPNRIALSNKNANAGMVVTWTNFEETINDGWVRELQYESLPPYQSFRLWSVGPNGTNENGQGDDIGVKWAE